MNDGRFPGETPDQLYQMALDSLRNYHDLSVLSRSGWAETSLISLLLLEGDEKYPESRGIGVRITLDWALEKLRSGRLEREQESYELLKIRFVEREPQKVYMQRKNIEYESTASARQRSAIERLSRILAEELDTPQEIEQRKYRVIKERYGLQSKQKQDILDALAVFRTSVRLESAKQLVRASEKAIHSLANVNLVCLNQEQTLVEVHPEARTFLLGQLTLKKRRSCNERAVQIYEAQNNFLEAAYHWQQAGRPEQAAGLLISNRHKFGSEALPIEPLKPLLGTFKRNDLSDHQWAYIKLLTGRIAEIAEEMTNAIIEFEQALEVQNDLIRAEVHFWMGRAYRQTNAERSLDHYKQCEELLVRDNSTEAQQHLARSLASKAWLLLEQKKDIEQAEQILKKAQQIVQEYEQDPEWFATLSDVHNSWGQFYGQQGLSDHELAQCKLAWEYAYSTPDRDIEQGLNTTYNLGIAYYWAGQYKEAQAQFEISLKLAQQSGNRRKEALNYKGLGQCCYGEKAYAAAIEHYMKMYAYCRETSNFSWLASACYDLTEAYIEYGEVAEARKFYKEGVDLTEAYGFKRVRQELAGLAETYQELVADLRESQFAAIGVMRRENKITNRRYCEETGLSREAAALHLNDLVEKGLCERVGQGRSTAYVIRSSQPSVASSQV